MNPLAHEDQVHTLVLELNSSELEVVVAGEGGHCVGRGTPSCLVCATHTPARLHLEERTAENWLKAPREKRSIGVNRRKGTACPTLNCIYTDIVKCT